MAYVLRHGIGTLGLKQYIVPRLEAFSMNECYVREVRMCDGKSKSHARLSLSAVEHIACYLITVNSYWTRLVPQ